MVNFFSPQTLPAILAAILSTSVIGAGILFFLGNLRKQDLELLRSTNKDQGDRITLLESSVARLTEQVAELERRNKTLEDLVITALKQYFFENPKVASTMKDIINPQP